MTEITERTPSETAAQDAINAAAARSSAEYHARLRQMPRWRQWLVRRLAPSWPVTLAEMPPGTVEVTRPLEMAPGVGLSGLHVVPAAGDPEG
jgi:hypothetical protein